MRSIVIIFSLFFLFSGHAYSAEKTFVVVIDPGHGGRDGGAARGTYKEKDITLAIALQLGRAIENNHKDVKVVYTRKTDETLILSDRAQTANKAKANLFISIHVNSSKAKSTTANGTEVYMLGVTKSAENLEVAKRENSVILLEENYQTRYEGFDPNSPESNIIFEFMTNKYMDQSLELASHVQNAFGSVAKRHDRGVRQAGFLVLKAVSMPSILVELGFINNTEEAKYLSSKPGQKSMSDALYSGFKKYKYDFDKRQGSAKLLANTDQEQDDAVTESKVETKEKSVETARTAEKAESKNTPAKAVEEKAVSPKQNEKRTTSPSKIESRKEIEDQIEYRVQFFISKTEIQEGSAQLKGLTPVEYYADDGHFKYTFGSTTDSNEILKSLRIAKTKFKDAFVIKFKNGKRIK